MSALIAHLFFWVLVAGVLVGRARLSLLCYIMLMHFDLSQISFVAGEFSSGSSVGYENALKVMVLPFILLIKLRFRPSIYMQGNAVIGAWILLVGYAALSALWSPFTLSAVKMVIYLGWHLLAFGLFTYAWLTGRLTEKDIVVLLWVGIAFAFAKTFLLEEYYVGKRLSTYINIQVFASFVVAFLSMILSFGSFRYKGPLIVASIFSVLLTGSRFAILGLVGLFLVWGYYRFKQRRNLQAVLFVIFGSMMFVMSIVATVWVLRVYYPENRINEMFDGITELNYEKVNTLRWRFGMYEEAVRQLKARGTSAVFIRGSGTSSGGVVAIAYKPLRYKYGELDANRVLHNEFIRALYEWGLIGLVLFLFFLLSLFVSYSRLLQKHQVQAALAFMGIIPVIATSVLVENMLAGAGTMGNTGILIVMTYGYASYLRKSGKTPRKFGRRFLKTLKGSEPTP